MKINLDMLYTVDIELEDGTYFQKVYVATTANEALDKALAEFPNAVSVGTPCK